MPGVKRKASTAPGEKLPVKLKKQSTSTTVGQAIPTQTQKTSKKPTFSKINESPNEPRKVTGELKKKKSLPTLPRFPTLVPSKPVGATGSDFVFNISPTSSPPKDNLSEIGVSSKSSTSEVPGLRKETTTLIQTNSSGDPSVNKASDIEKSVLRLSSGSYVGRIMNKDVDDQMLPSLESMAVYEQKNKQKSSDAPFTWDMTDDVSPVRKSVYDVNAVLNMLEQESSPTKCSVGSNTSDDGSDAPPVLQAEVYDTTSCEEDYEDNASVPALTCMGTPSKSPCKSPRKMTGGPREIVFSFDTTGSMYNYMEEASYRMRELMNRVQEDMPGIRLAFVAHGDYYDLANDRYLIKWIDFGASVDEVDTFFENLPITHGGDADECYELVLRKVRESLTWSPGSQRSLVMIGDSDPHEPGYKFNDFENDIDWRQETKLLNEMGVRIYALQVGYTSNFYKQIAQMTGGAHLRIENKDFTYETLMSICLREGGLRHLKGFEHEVRSAAKKSGSNGGTLDLELERLFSSLKNIADNKSLKQRERENKLKARILEMTTDSKTLSPTKRPSENEASTSGIKKPKVSSKSVAKLPSQKSESTNSPKKLTKIKEKSVDQKKASIEKVKKVPKIKSPSTKLLKQKSTAKIVEKKISKKTSKTENQKTSGKLKKAASDNKPKKPRGRPPKVETAKSKKSVGKPGKMVESGKSKKSVAKPQKTVESAKPRGRPPKKEENPKLKEGSKKSQVMGKPLKKVASKSPGRPSKATKSPKKLGKPVKKIDQMKTPNRPANKVKMLKVTGKPNKKVESPKSNITTKKKEETSLKSPSSVVQRIVAAKLKRLGKMGTNSKVKIPKKVQSTVKTKDKKTPVKSKVITKTKVAAKSMEKAVANKKLSSKKDSSKRKTLSAKLSLKKMESKAKIAKLKAAKTKQVKKTTGKSSAKEKKKTVTKPTKSAKTIKKNVRQKKQGKPSNINKKQNAKASNKPVKKETKKSGISAANKGKKSPGKTDTGKKTPAKSDTKAKKSAPEKKNSVKPKTPQKSKTSNTEQRENISGSKFSTGPLSNVKWSPWIGIISPKSNGADWSKSRSWCGGHSNEALYKGEGVTQALYEAAVVPPGSNNKYVVTYGVGQGVPAVRVWDCFTSQHVRQQVQRIVREKGSICVRRGVIAGRAKDSLSKAEDYIKENFDYAWRGSHRKTEVRKEGFLVSKP